MSLFSALFPSVRRAGRSRAADSSARPEWAPLPIGAVLLAIDPSIARAGWALIRNDKPCPIRLDSDCWYPCGDHMNRFDHLATLIAQRIRLATEAGHAPTHAVIETPRGGGRGGQQMQMYLRAVGVCEATCFRKGLVTNRVGVTEWKGSGKKSHTGLVVEHIFKFKPREANESDALGIGLWLCNHKIRSLAPAGGEGRE